MYHSNIRNSGQEIYLIVGNGMLETIQKVIRENAKTFLGGVGKLALDITF